MVDFISVILPSYNPCASRLEKTLNALKHQTLPADQWEIILIDNNSSPALKADISWHPHHKTVIERQQGLTYARLQGFERAVGDLIIMVDDDNILDANYLSNALAIFKSNKKLGAFGGKSLPLFESPEPHWIKDFYGSLALRDLGAGQLVAGWEGTFPSFAPIGAGMCIRKAAIAPFIKKIRAGGEVIADRTGRQLTSGGDNDLVLEILTSGWLIGYYPSLELVHIMPKERLSVSYLAKLLNNTNRSWISVLQKHHINPWRPVSAWTVPLRKIKAWFTYKAWKDEAGYIKWQGACGLFDGLAAIKTCAKT